MKVDLNDTMQREGPEGVRARSDNAKSYNGRAPEDEVGLVGRRAATITPEPVDWIWERRLARGKHTAIAGEPGLGKSQFAIFATATITRGASWPDGFGAAKKGRAIILSAEDDPADTIVPRLMAAGADLEQVEIIEAAKDGDKQRPFSLQTDLEKLEHYAKRMGDVELISMDPLSAYLGGGGMDSHRDTEVRSVLAPVSEMAARLGTGILTVSHFNKGAGNSKALHKFMGSVAFIAAPRVGFAIIEDMEDAERRLFLHVKNNLSPPAVGLAFRLGQKIITDSGITGSHIVWEAETVNMTADQAVAERREKATSPKLEDARGFLQQVIGTRGIEVTALEEEAKSAGISWATIRRAKDALGIKSQKSGADGPWMWKLP
jgi:putative DNA primase/helicase